MTNNESTINPGNSRRMAISLIPELPDILDDQFELQASFVIRHSSFVISPLFS